MYLFFGTFVEIPCIHVGYFFKKEMTFQSGSICSIPFILLLKVCLKN